MRIVKLAKKDPAEIIPVMFDFTGLVKKIDSAATTISVRLGVDGDPSVLVVASAQIIGTQVKQLIQGGIDGVIYRIRMDIVRGGEQHAVAVYLPVSTLL